MEVLRYRKDFDCRTCKWGHHCDSSNPAPLKQWEIKGVLESDVCLLPMVSEKSWHLIRLHKHYQKNVLFTDGGLMSQPNLYLEAMERIEEYGAGNE